MELYLHSPNNFMTCAETTLPCTRIPAISCSLLTEVFHTVR